MDDIGVLGLEWIIGVLAPWELLVAHPLWGSVVTSGEYVMICVHYHRPDLRGWVLRSTGDDKSGCHECLVPVQDVFTMIIGHQGQIPSN